MRGSFGTYRYIPPTSTYHQYLHRSQIFFKSHILLAHQQEEAEMTSGTTPEQLLPLHDAGKGFMRKKRTNLPNAHIS